MFCHEGGGWVDLGGHHRVEAGSIVQIPGWIAHLVRFRPGTHFSALTFDASRYPSEWLRPLEAQRAHPGVLSRPGWGRRFERWADQPEQLLPWLARELAVVEPWPETVGSALALAHEAVSRGWGASEIARKMGYSLPHLTTRVSRATGRSLGQWVQDARLDLAAMMLRHQQHSVAEVARQCGYQDLTHFRRAFKKKSGRVPSVYKHEENYEQL